MSPQRYEPFRVGDIAPYVKLWAESNPNSPENLYQKQLRDIQMKQAILNLKTPITKEKDGQLYQFNPDNGQWTPAQGFTPQPQATYGDILGGVFESGISPQYTQMTPQEQDIQRQSRAQFEPGYTPQPSMRDPTEQEVIQRESQFFPTSKTPTPKWVESGKAERFPKGEPTIGGFQEKVLREKYLQYKTGRLKSDDSTLQILARSLGVETTAEVPKDMTFKEFVGYVTGGTTTQQERITMKAPDGTIGTIPANQLQEALKSGYIQVK